MDDYHIFYKLSGFWHTEAGLVPHCFSSEMEKARDFMPYDDKVRFIASLVQNLCDFMEVDIVEVSETF